MALNVFYIEPLPHKKAYQATDKLMNQKYHSLILEMIM